MGALSPMHLLLILGIAVLILGPKRLPEAGEALGRALREFREAVGADTPPGPATTADTADATLVAATTAGPATATPVPDSDRPDGAPTA